MKLSNVRKLSQWQQSEWCEFCAKSTTHHCQERGAWEYHRCAECGNQKQYKVR